MVDSWGRGCCNCVALGEMTVSFYFSIDNLGEDPGTLLSDAKNVPRKPSVMAVEVAGRTPAWRNALDFV